MNRIEKIKEMMAQSPNDSFLQHALALELVKEGKDADAKAVFNQLLQANATYVGSYYHLAKLLERTGERDEALKTYQNGMQVARQAGDTHAYNELQAAYEDLEDG